MEPLRSGGHQQRLARREERPVVSLLARHLLEEFGFGRVSATHCQLVANLCVKDHADSPEELRSIAALGGWGKHQSNIHTELCALIKARLKLQEPLEFAMPLKTLKRLRDDSRIEVLGRSSIIPPYRVAGDMWAHRQKEFCKRFVGVEYVTAMPRALTRFWKSAVHPEDPRLAPLLEAYQKNGVVTDFDDFARRAIPIALHGDAVPCTNRMSLDALSWSSCLTNAPSEDAKFLMTGLLDRTICDGSRSSMWSMVIWALCPLLLGRYPQKDWAGRDWTPGTSDQRNGGSPLCGNYFFVIWQMRGDLDYFSNYLDLEHFRALFCCPWCEANLLEDPADPRCAVWNVIPRPWNDWSDRAAWLNSCWASHSAWLEAHGGVSNVHEIFRLPGVCIFTVRPDSLHIMELGVVHRIIGNTLFHLCFTAGLVPGDGPAARLARVWDSIVASYRALQVPVQLGALKLSMFCNPDSPHRQQPNLTTMVKAAESRYLAEVMPAVFSSFLRPGDAVDKHILACLQNLNTYYTCLSCTDYRLPDATQRDLRGALWAMNRHYNFLGAWARENHLRRWGVTPKFHYALHIALGSIYENPRKSWTYLDEDAMSLWKSIGESSTRGTAAQDVVRKMTRRYLMGIDLRMHHRE